MPASTQALVGLSSAIQAHAYAPGTVRNLHSQWKAYLAFCTTFNLVAIPATARTISTYAAYLSCKTSSYQSILNHLNALRLFHLFSGVPCDALTSFDVTLTKKGLKRLMGAAPQQKYPITIAILRDIRGILDLEQPSQAALWCLFLVAFFSFLRRSNLTVSSLSAFSPAKHLTREDLKLTAAGAILRIKWSKTLQYQERTLFVPIPSIPVSDLCPIQAISHYLQRVPATPAAPFFCLANKSGLHPITHRSFSASLKRLLTCTGHDATKYSPHSFRRGGATFAYQAGVPERLIQRHGDWSSDAYRRYLVLPLTTRTLVADIMATGLAGSSDTSPTSS